MWKFIINVDNNCVYMYIVLCACVCYVKGVVWKGLFVVLFFLFIVFIVFFCF